jgi:hypothetical protein
MEEKRYTYPNKPILAGKWWNIEPSIHKMKTTIAWVVDQEGKTIETINPVYVKKDRQGNEWYETKLE